MSSEQEARAYQLGAVDGIDAANTDAPTPESNAGTVLGRAWTAAADQVELNSQTEREEYFMGWTHGYVVRAEGIEDAEHEREAILHPEECPESCRAGRNTKATLPQSAAPSNSPVKAGKSSSLLAQGDGRDNGEPVSNDK